MEEKYTPIQNFITEVKTYLIEQKNANFIEESYTQINGKLKIIDSAIVSNNEILAIFEFKAGAKEIKLQDLYESLSTLGNVSFKFLVLSTGIYHKVLNRYSDEIMEFETIKSLLNFLFNEPNQNKINEQIESIAETIEKAVLDFFIDINSYVSSELKENLESYFTKEELQKNIHYNYDGQFFHLSTDIRDLTNFENSFFRLLIEEVKANESIYRYTTLNTVFATVQHNSVRLNGIVGMNDISEVKYVESYLDDSFIPMENDKDVEHINNRFILCSSTLNDNLMQWRLYGDDCKGACMKLTVKETDMSSEFQLRKINYGREVNGKNYHPELELISKIIKAVKEQNKQSIQFRTLEIWKHFFKSFEYSPEQEVRLLLIPLDECKDWCITMSHQIVSPFVTIPFSNTLLPFELTEIILGPKCPEDIVNKKQFEQLLREKSLSNVTTKFSRIKNYR